MSFPDPTPPSSNSFVTLPYAGGGDMGGFWPPPQMNQENLEMYSQFENEPPFKRTRSSEINPGASIQNPKVNPPNLPGKGSNHIFYKTRMCVKFMEGNCRNGEHCTFAHGVEDLREPPPNWQDIIREKDRAGPGNWNSNDHQKVMHRMKICKKFYNGEECPYGERCNFLHERAPQFIKNDMGREQRESSAISIGTTGSMMGRRSDSGQFEINQHASVDSDAYRIKPMFLKTKICSKWEITGQCPFGERCNFAHGQSELKAHASRTEMEATTNFAPAPIKPLAPGLDPSSANAVPGVPVNEQQQPQEGKKFLKWKLTKKISPIYADWIDGFVPPHLLFGKGEDEF